MDQSSNNHPFKASPAVEPSFVETPVVELMDELKKCIGLYRQLLENVRHERESLIEANLKRLQEVTFEKEALLATLSQVETRRQKTIAELGKAFKLKSEELNLSKIIEIVQGHNLKLADALRSTWNTLTILIQRIQEQNLGNRSLVQNSLHHIQAMKRNLLGSEEKASQTYNQSGQRTPSQSGARLLSKEV